MAVPPRTATAGTLFLAAITANRRRLFQVETNARLLLGTLQHYRAQGLYKLHAFVVMPDHLHLLLTTDDLPNTMQHLHGGFSHRLALKLAVWQRGYTDHLIRSHAEFDTRLVYIHHNPVRARLVERRRIPVFLSLLRLEEGVAELMPFRDAQTDENKPAPCQLHLFFSKPRSAAMPNETETNAEFQSRTSTSIAELRQKYGAHFAPGYGDQDTLGELLGRAGFNTLDEYLSQHHHSMTPKSSN